MRAEIDWKKLSVAIGKVATDLVTGNAGEAIKSGVEAAEAFGWERTQPPNAEEGAALLLHRTLCAAVLNTFRQFASAARPLTVTADPVEIQARLSGLAGAQPVELTAEAFNNPSAWRAIDVVQTEFAKWQTFCGVAEPVRDPMLRFFRQEMPMALTLEMRNRPDDYASLLRALAPLPGDEAARFEAQWRTYRAELVRRVREPLFRLDPNELPPVALADIYVPLRAWMTVRGMPERGHRGHAEDETPPKKRVVWLEDNIRQWLKRADHRDGVRVIGGEPGAGKSSFAKIIAAKLSHENQRVLLVPLGRLNYHADALMAVTAYVRTCLQAGRPSA